NGEGSIYQRADGRWAGAAYVTTTDGTTRRVHVYGESHREASDNLAATLADNVRGTAVLAKDPNLTVGEYLTSWLHTVAKPRGAGHHIPQLRADDPPLPDPRPRHAPARCADRLGGARAPARRRHGLPVLRPRHRRQA